jgi:hypothetical protein
MKKTLILFSILILTFSCKRETQQNQDETIEESIEPILNFEIINVSKSEYNFIPDSDYFFTHFQDFEIKNKSNVSFNHFGFDTEIMAIFENGDTITSVRYGGYESNVDVKNLWKPNTNRKFSIATSERDPFLGLVFIERTPISLLMTYKFNAKGIDGEIEESQSFNIIKDWKNFQIKLGYRQL